MVPQTKGLYHLTLRASLHDQAVQNGWYFQDNNTSPHDGSYQASLASLSNNFMTRIYPLIKAFQSTQVHYLGLIGTTIWPHFGPVWEIGIEVGSGDQPGESLPSFVAGVLSLRTGFGGARHRGRSYFAGVSEADSADSRLDPDSFSRLSSIGNELLSGYGFYTDPGHVWHYGVWSWRSALEDGGTRDNPNSAAWQPVAQTLPRLFLGSQNHRKAGSGI